MKALKESIFAIVRRRENIKMLGTRPISLLPSFMIEGDFKHNPYQDFSLDQNSQASQEHLNEDLKKLLTQKQAHLSLPYKKVGKKMNRFSVIGLMVGLFLIGSLFFITGFLICYSIYPPYSGLNFPVNYKAVSETSSSSFYRSPSTTEVNDPSISTAQISEKKYADRQKLLKSSNTPSQPSLLEQAEQKTFNNIKYQFKVAFLNSIQSFSQKIRQIIGPFLSNLVSPLTNDLPQQFAQEKANEINNIQIIPQNSKNNPLINKDKALDLKQSDPSLNKTEENSLVKDLYSIRLQKFQLREEALKFAQELKEKGFDSYITPIWSQQSVIYEVRSGSYSSFQEVRQSINILKQVGIDFATIIMTQQNEERLKP